MNKAAPNSADTAWTSLGMSVPEPTAEDVITDAADAQPQKWTEVDNLHWPRQSPTTSSPRLANKLSESAAPKSSKRLHDVEHLWPRRQGKTAQTLRRDDHAVLRPMRDGLLVCTAKLRSRTGQGTDSRHCTCIDQPAGSCTRTRHRPSKRHRLSTGRGRAPAAEACNPRSKPRLRLPLPRHDKLFKEGQVRTRLPTERSQNRRNYKQS